MPSILTLLTRGRTHNGDKTLVRMEQFFDKGNEPALPRGYQKPFDWDSTSEPKLGAKANHQSALEHSVALAGELNKAHRHMEFRKGAGNQEGSFAANVNPCWQS